MGPFYELLAAELQINVDKDLLADLKQKNAKKLKEIDDEILDAEQNLGESEVRQAFLKKSEYLCQIGDKDAAVSAFRQTYEKTVGMGYRIDLVFNLIRLGLFFLDHKLISANISKAKGLMEQVCFFLLYNRHWLFVNFRVVTGNAKIVSDLMKAYTKWPLVISKVLQPYSSKPFQLLVLTNSCHMKILYSIPS